LNLSDEFLDAASIGGSFRFWSVRGGALFDLCAAAGTDEQPSFPSKLAICLRYGVEMNPDIESQSAHSR
jgi:hypothetical protein